MSKWKLILSKNGLKISVIFVVFLVMSGFVFPTRSDSNLSRENYSAASGERNRALSDSDKSLEAFGEAVKVFFSARCANCHPAGDFPTQGDEMVQHSMDVMRGPEGKGTPEYACSTCHQDVNLDGDGMPPGVPNWHMPPADHKMPFQGVTAGDLCRQLKDPAKNGGRKTAKEAVAHLASDPLVLWAWSPGNGRSTPPLSHADFLKKMTEWAENGAECPK
jgi:hypothetical protein